MPSLRAAHCPAAAPVSLRPPGPPRPAALSCSLTMPGEPHSAVIARTAIRSALHTHGLDRHTDLAVLVATELIGTATQLTPEEDLYFSLRYRAGALRLVLWDQHPRHRDPDAVTLCEVRRRSLWLLAALTDDCGGHWGAAAAQLPQRGTKSWAVLPCGSP